MFTQQHTIPIGTSQNHDSTLAGQEAARMAADRLEVVDVSRGWEGRGFDITGHRYWFDHPWARTVLVRPVQRVVMHREHRIVTGAGVSAGIDMGLALVAGLYTAAGGLAAVPHAYFSHQLDNQVWLGLAINVPFGLTTEYKSDWVGRYHAIKSEVKTVNINPSIAYKLNNQVSVAAWVSAMYLAGHFTNAVDFGLLTGNPFWYALATTGLKR